MTQKSASNTKQSDYLQYKLGQIDEKLVTNEAAHRDITETLKGISATLIDVRASISVLNKEAAVRIEQVQIGVATTATQIADNTQKIGILETKLYDIKAEQDRWVGRATAIGAVASGVMAILIWVGKTIIQLTIGGK